MSRVSQAVKDVIIKKALDKQTDLRSLAKQNNIGYSTLVKWRLKYLSEKSINIPRDSKYKQPSRAERLQHILSTAALNEQEIGVYCRERGLYAVQLAEWKNAM